MTSEFLGRNSSDFNSFDTDVVHGTRMRIEESVHVIDYIRNVHTAFLTPLAEGDSMMRTLEVVALLFEENRPGLGKDPSRPHQTAFMMGACLALDSSSQLIRMNDMDESGVLNTWVGSTNFIVKVAGEDDSKEALQNTLTLAASASSEGRLKQLNKLYSELLFEYGERCLDEGVIAPEQLLSMRYGFAFVFAGISTTLDLIRINQLPDLELTDEAIATWLAG